MTTATHTWGANTIAEILSQARCWTECLAGLRERGELARVRREFPDRKEWVFFGCGSSYYLAQAAAATWTTLAGGRARALAASELLLFPELALAGARDFQPVLVSRSGYTSEVLQAAEYLEHTMDVRCLAITCAAETPLEAACSATLRLLRADEKSTVMTRSFTSMLLALQSLAAEYAGEAAFAESLGRLAPLVQPLLDSMQMRVRAFVEVHDFEDYVFLAQGPYFGIASEAMLKVKEMSCSYAQCFHTLEFRHGPKAIVGPETLLAFFLSEQGYTAERAVLEDIKALGGTTWVVTNHADEATRRVADFLVELHLDVPEAARIAAAAIPAQLLGYYTGLKRGFDPDRPRHLSRVVTLEDNN